MQHHVLIIATVDQKKYVYKRNCVNQGHATLTDSVPVELVALIGIVKVRMVAGTDLL